MSAPVLTFTHDKSKISTVAGFDCITVGFSSDVAYTRFECRATKVGESYGVGKGTLIASFSSTPANTSRTFEIYDEYLVNGDGEYRISLYALSEDGYWNFEYNFIPDGSTRLITSDGKRFVTATKEAS